MEEEFFLGEVVGSIVIDQALNRILGLDIPLSFSIGFSIAYSTCVISKLPWKTTRRHFEYTSINSETQDRNSIREKFTEMGFHLRRRTINK